MLEGADIHDSLDEQWQFLPGSMVVVEEKISSGVENKERILFAVRALKGTTYIGDFGICGSKIHSVQQQNQFVALTLSGSGYG